MTVSDSNIQHIQNFKNAIVFYASKYLEGTGFEKAIDNDRFANALIEHANAWLDAMASSWQGGNDEK